MSYVPTQEEAPAYEHLFRVATRGQMSTIGGGDAVKFFIASGLQVPTLKQVWAIASNGQKEMGQKEFYTAMRLIALAQNNYTVDENSLRETVGVTVNSPRFQGVELPTPPPAAVPQPATPSPPTPGASPASWAIPAEQRAGYEKLWGGLQKNAQGFLEGKDAAAFFAKSGQNRDTLRHVWQLADVGGDGMMDIAEFLIGMHLTMMAKKGATLPATLPQDLLRSASTPFERSASNTSQLSASMMQMMQPASNSVLGESDVNASRLVKQNSARAPENPAAPTPSGDVEYDSLRNDAVSMNASLSMAGSRMEEARSAVRAQTTRATGELGALRAERERLMQALMESTNAFNNDMEKLRQLDEELAQLRDEVARIRQSVDAKRAAVGAQQDMIGARLDETRALTKQVAGVTLGGGDAQAGQKRRQPPVPPAAGDFFQDSGFPSGDTAAHHQPPATSSNAFDAFDDPYGAQGSGGKSNEY